jgi:hypothetical protein
MSRATRSAIAAAILLMIVGMLLPDGSERLTPTSFGTYPHGYRALYELLSELGFPVRRGFDPPDRIAAGSSVWWITPDGLCLAEEVGAEFGEEEAAPWQLTEFLKAGGTAVVFPPPDCARLGALAIPSRSSSASAGEASEEEEEPSDPDLFDRWLAGDFSLVEIATEPQQLEGEPGPGHRELDAPPLLRFQEAGDFEVRARLDGEPFILEMQMEAGTLVLVADASFLTNALLDRADAAPLAVDLASHYGASFLDEYSHGMHRERNPIPYLARSGALPVFAGLALLGLLALWRGSSLPRRCVDEVDLPAPTLDRFVASLASLYARSRDKGRVAERYRELTLARLRRHFGLPAETPAKRIVERLRRDRRLSPALLGCLTEAEPPRGEAALRAQTRRLDALVKEAVR